jgi:hypothetical protein
MVGHRDRAYKSSITGANVTSRGDPPAEIVAPNQQGDLVTVSADRVTL